MLKDKLQEFFEVWDAYWNSGAGEGPSFPEFEAKALELKAEIGYVPVTDESKPKKKKTKR